MPVETKPRTKPITVKASAAEDGKLKVEVERKQLVYDDVNDPSIWEDFQNLCGGFVKAVKYLNKALDRDACNNARNAGNTQPDGTEVSVVVSKTQHAASEWTPSVRTTMTQKEKAEQVDTMKSFLESIASSGGPIDPETIKKFMEEQLAAAM